MALQRFEVSHFCLIRHGQLHWSVSSTTVRFLIPVAHFPPRDYNYFQAFMFVSGSQPFLPHQAVVDSEGKLLMLSDRFRITVAEPRAALIYTLYKIYGLLFAEVQSLLSFFPLP